MNNYLGLIIGVENYHGKITPVKYATSDATEFRNSLINMGCDEDNLELVVNERATRTTILEQIKIISKSATENDIIVFYYAGHGVFHNGKNMLTCVDSSKHSIPETTIGLDQILGALDKSKSNKVIAFLDCCHSGIEFSEVERDLVSEFSTDDLKYQYSNAEHLIVFASCKSDEKSVTDLQRKHGVWSYYLLKALRGEADDEVYESDLLFSDRLQKYLLEKTFRRAKYITTEKNNQTPIKYGKETAEKFIVADLTNIFHARKSKIKTEGIRFERATILTSEEDWVRNLPGFNKAKGHKEPKIVGSYQEEWIKKISTDLIIEELNEVGEKLKSKMNYKRKDVEVSEVDDGIGQITTMDFDYVVTITQSKVEPGTYVLTRSIENFKNSDILTNPKFNEVFDDAFDELELTLKEKLKVKSVIDRIEAINKTELVWLDYEYADTSKCKIYMKGLEGYIDLTGGAIKLVSPSKSSPEQLIMSFKDTYLALEQYKVPKILLQ